MCESETGRIFEITREGEVVWEYFNGDVRTEDGRKERAAIYRARWFPPTVALN